MQVHAIQCAVLHVTDSLKGTVPANVGANACISVAVVWALMRLYRVCCYRTTEINGETVLAHFVF